MSEPSRRTVLRTLSAGTGAVALTTWPAAGSAEALPAVTPEATPATPSRTGDNPVVRENSEPGSEYWGLGFDETRGVDPDRPQVQGHASSASVAPGETLGLHLASRTARRCDVEIYRLGHYRGVRARHLLTASEVPVPAGAGARPDWTVTVPGSWVSGIFLAVLTSADAYRAYAPFVVREPARASDVLAVVPLTTARGPYPGLGMSPGFGTDASASRWLEEAGYDVTYATEQDLHEGRVDPARYKAVVLPGAPGENRWSPKTRAAVERTVGERAVVLSRPLALSEPGRTDDEIRRTTAGLLDTLTG